ncbi:MAG: hypothetical protein U0Q12_10250 [Vicinamibacterales bacterium]
MTRRFLIITGVIAMMLWVAPASAHDDYRIIGTVLKVAAGKIDVKQTKDGKTISMKTDAATIVTRDKKKVSSAELKTGTNVVVDASGDSLQDLTVLEVRIVPAPTAK